MPGPQQPPPQVAAPPEPPPTVLGTFADQYGLRQPVLDAMRRLSSDVRGYVSSLFTPDPTIQKTADLLKEQYAAQLPTSGNPTVDALATGPGKAAVNFGIDQFADLTTPGGAALTLDAPVKAAAAGLPALLGAARVLRGAPTARTIRGVREGMGSLGKTLVETGQKGFYELHPVAKERIRQLYEIGRNLEQQADWRGAKSPDLIRAMGGDRSAARLWSEFWSALTAGTNVPNSTAESIPVWLHYLEHPEVPYSKELLSKMEVGLPNAKHANLNKALWDMPMQKEKVEAMRQFMLGHGRIPIDRHTLYAGGVDLPEELMTFNVQAPALKQFLTAAGEVDPTNARAYHAYEQALRDALIEIDPHTDFNKVFGRFWEGTRSYKGQPYQGGALDILRHKGLFQFGAMLDRDALRSVLGSKGWSAVAIAGLLAALDQGQAQNQVATPPPAAPPTLLPQR